MKSKIVCSILLFIFFSSFSHTCSQYLHSEKLSLNKFSLTDTNKIQLKEKSPLLAGTLSFIVPGFALGQLYNGHIKKFFAHSFISFGCITALIISAGKLIQIDFGGGSSKGVGLFLAIFFVYTGNWIWSVVDAVTSANEINKKVQFKKYRSDVLDKLKFGFSHGKNKQLNFNLAFEL